MDGRSSLVQKFTVFCALFWMVSGCVDESDMEKYVADACLDERIVTGRSYGLPVSALVVSVEDEPYGGYRSVELQNLLYEVASDHSLVRNVDPRTPDEIIFYPRSLRKRCGPELELWTSIDKKCAVVQIRDRGGVWTQESVQFYSVLEGALDALRGQVTIPYLKPDISQNDMWRLETGPLEDPYGGRSLDWEKVCGDLQEEGERNDV